jgi:ubiquinone/menaquinone biosynthesis C-methylase UbiE
MKTAATFWDRIAARYSKKPVPDEAVYQRKLEVTREYFRPDMQVLEFGCGTGSTAIAHAPFVRHILATDISDRMLEIARGKAADAAVDNVTFHQATLEELDEPDESFDVVLGLSILHLLEDKEAAIARVRRLLKPGGVFVSSTVCAGDTMRWIKLIIPVGRRLGLMPYVGVFTSDELVTAMGAAGFEIDHRWQPGRGKALFLVARKPG